jgi:hypothetical protein
MSSLDQRSLNALLAKVNKFHTRLRNETDEEYRHRVCDGGVESDNSYAILLENGYDVVPSGLTDPKRKYMLVLAEPIVEVGTADGPSAGNGHPIDLSGEDEGPALSGKENNRNPKKRSSTHQEMGVVKKQRSTLASMGSDDAYQLVIKGTYYYYCALFNVTLNSFLFLLLYPLL